MFRNALLYHLILLCVFLPVATVLQGRSAPEIRELHHPEARERHVEDGRLIPLTHATFDAQVTYLGLNLPCRTRGRTDNQRTLDLLF